MRLFVAVDLPEDVKKKLADICFGLPGARWVPLDQLHLTVRFIGEVDGGLFQDIRSRLEEVQGDGFPVTLKGLGHFPPKKNPRVIWVGIDKCDQLDQLRKKIDSSLMSVGIPPEKRKFSPHITLARLKKTPLNRITDFLAGNALFALPEFEVKNFFLYSSTLTPKGAIHHQEAVYSLV